MEISSARANVCMCTLIGGQFSLLAVDTNAQLHRGDLTQTLYIYSTVLL